MTFKIEKLTVGKGRTMRPTEAEEWTRIYYEVIMDVSELPDSVQVDHARVLAEKMLDTWLGQQASIPPEAVSALGIPKIDIAELDESGWQTFQKKPAKPSQAAWIRNPVAFTSWQDPPAVLLELVKALARTKDHELILGDMKYVYGGPKDNPEQFIHRKPVKTESAR